MCGGGVSAQISHDVSNLKSIEKSKDREMWKRGSGRGGLQGCQNKPITSSAEFQVCSLLAFRSPGTITQ